VNAASESQRLRLTVEGEDGIMLTRHLLAACAVSGALACVSASWAQTQQTPRGARTFGAAPK